MPKKETYVRENISRWLETFFPDIWDQWLARRATIRKEQAREYMATKYAKLREIRAAKEAASQKRLD